MRMCKNGWMNHWCTDACLCSSSLSSSTPRQHKESFVAAVPESRTVGDHISDSEKQQQRQRKRCDSRWQKTRDDPTRIEKAREKRHHERLLNIYQTTFTAIPRRIPTTTAASASSAARARAATPKSNGINKLSTRSNVLPEYNQQIV